jgi:hypothetical protein
MLIDGHRHQVNSDRKARIDSVTADPHRNFGSGSFVARGLSLNLHPQNAGFEARCVAMFRRH